MGLVVSIVKSFHPINPTVLDEYIQAGRIGLLKAVRKHDIARSSFSTTAWHYIRWAILHYIDREKTDTALPITIDPSGIQHENVSDYFPSTLSDNERNVITLRTKGYTFKDIGEIKGYSKSWANYVFHSGVAKIREANYIE